MTAVPIRPRTGTGVALLSIAACLGGFAALAVAVHGGRTPEWDIRMLLMLRNPADPADPLGPPWLDLVARDLTALGGSALLSLATLAAAGTLLMRRCRALAAAVAAALAGAQALSSALKWLIGRPRPDLVPHGVEVHTASFPSGHAMMAAACWLTFAALRARREPSLRMRRFWYAAAALVVLLVGVSRVRLGVHWPSDVLAGWMLGTAWALGAALATRRLAA